MVSAVVAVDKNWGIGRNGDLLANIPLDKKFFKSVTSGHTVIMGRKTWDSLPKKPLPNRENYVITRTPDNNSDNVKFITLSDAINMIENSGKNSDVFIIGGGQIYSKLLPYCDTVYVTKIYKSYEADTFFPNIDKDENWIGKEISYVNCYNGIEFQFFEYKKQ